MAHEIIASSHNIILKLKQRPDMVVHAFISITQEEEVNGTLYGEFQVIQEYTVRPCLKENQTSKYHHHSVDNKLTNMYLIVHHITYYNIYYGVRF